MFSYMADFVNLSLLGLCSLVLFYFVGGWLLQSRKTYLFSTNSVTVFLPFASFLGFDF